MCDCSKWDCVSPSGTWVELSKETPVTPMEGSSPCFVFFVLFLVFLFVCCWWFF